MSASAFLFRSFLCIAAVMAVVPTRAAFSESLDEKELTRRYFTQGILADVHFEASCTESDGQRACFFDASIRSWEPTNVDASYKDKFDAIVRTYKHLLQDEVTFGTKLHFILHLNSGGGNLPLATEIGRQVRALHIDVRVDDGAECYSACIFVLMGGEYRSMSGKIGIHRPYFEVPTGQLSQTIIKQQTDQMVASLRDYAREMNTSPQIIDDMLIVPPENVRILTPSELDHYGFTREDPVRREARALEEAKGWGLTRSEYMKRKQRVKSDCKVFEAECYRDTMSGRR